jgi:DNA-binding PadR family transcriptional regulator
MNNLPRLTCQVLVVLLYRKPISVNDINGFAVLQDFFLGFVKIHILYHASKEPIYGVEILEELGRHGYRPSPGTLYPTLHRLEREGYLCVERRVVGGKVRKYYSTTKQGQAVLTESRKKIAELVEEVLLDK